MMHLTYSISFASQCAMLEGKDGSRAYALAIPARLESFSHRNATLTCACKVGDDSDGDEANSIIKSLRKRRKTRKEKDIQVQGDQVHSCQL